MFANIENVMANYDENKFNIIVEFSRLPIETFNTEAEAQDFIRGYRSGLELTEVMKLGKYYRQCVELDMKDSVQYKKVNDLDVLLYDPPVGG
ncbi:hypothetical protein P4571_08180 [Niallia alba]|uniref:hypothetical protein n=1 Tax=Niallia alba TaxID=2729105 RepID=UPI002E214E5E|nr:hypothetical protein [Niallia alba]